MRCSVSFLTLNLNCMIFSCSFAGFAVVYSKQVRCYYTEWVVTSPFPGQRPGTSGLRKKVKVFMEKHYTENFIQCLLEAQREKLVGSTLVLGGDGRYYSKQAVNIIVRMCAANGVAKVLLGQGGVLSTPAVSNIIRKYKILGGIVLTASHNPGGIRADFGIKYNCENGGPAPDNVTDHIHSLTQIISRYRTVPDLDFDWGVIGSQKFTVDDRNFELQVIDPVEDYLSLMRSIFDFPSLRSLIRGSETRRPFNLLIDSMNGVTGPYVTRIFCEELGANSESVTRIIPLDNFGEIHPDPNLTYAKELVDRVRKNGEIDLGAAFDGDGDRNMILGQGGMFVVPSDSLAVLAAHLECIPYFKQQGVQGFARSMPTAGAVDRVAQKLGKEFFEVPTGWKYFGNLMDAGRLSLCGEESFGTGSSHIREKDGIWAVLAWLSVIASTGLSINEILHQHWSLYGRNYFTRYDYEECDLDQCNIMISELQQRVTSNELNQRTFIALGHEYTIEKADSFSYTDPIDKSVTSNQGIRIIFTDGSRVVYRLSGTGSSGATVRLYVDRYEPKDVLDDSQDKLKPLVQVALEIADLKRFTGREEPTVIT